MVEEARMTEQEQNTKYLEFYLAGIKSASASMRHVLARKVQVGILEEVTAKAIFEDIGTELDKALTAIRAEADKQNAK